MRYQDIEGMTNEEAVIYFGSLTVTSIPCGDLENLLGFAGLAKRNAVSGAWEGSLIDFMQSNAVPALSEGLGELFSHLNKPRSVGVDTFEQPWASKMGDLLGGLQMVGLVDARFISDVAGLALGFRHPDLDVDAVQAIRDEVAAEQAAKEEADAWFAALSANEAKWNALWNAHVAPLRDSKDFSDAAWIAALNAMASNWSN
jgi:hypothetical protein